MDIIEVHAGEATYPVEIGENVLLSLPSRVASLTPAVTSVFYIVDKAVYDQYEGRIKEHVPNHQHVFWHVIPAGEAAKTFDVYQQCLGAALEAGLDRHSLIIACGGGATGDLAGFVSATYMRGIRFIQLPTTILAHDSAVGGKVAINHPLGKNMVGSFHQPSAVLYDLSFLRTLPIKEVRSGFAEVIKHALIADPAFLEELMKNLSTLEDIEPSFLAYCLKKGVQIKSEIVRQDERETGVRAYLNFGHTYGHAIEAAAGYGKWTHGEAIMVGVVYALYISKQVNHCDFNVSLFIDWIQRLGYTLSIPEELSFTKLYDRMAQDKKTIANEIRFVLLEETGVPHLKKVTKELLEEADRFIRQIGREE
ncbi:3-dehydroquinate synthase [Jeotgalibacillus soli]|uniref:3-dehydroquinate synthase n=1 Tax=Jeotgalibacillus soli TaxID=889306 RepID=A0A0C2RR15_9BACL|nr:3-dehydroquinate synthase [Jeotgalibacillus soli]KIL44199.1 3-dehydroquinate synthase [Jeotgalibacillus soli]